LTPPRRGRHNSAQGNALGEYAFAHARLPCKGQLGDAVFGGPGFLSRHNQLLLFACASIAPFRRPSIRSTMCVEVGKIALLLPAVQSAREATRRARCANNL
jgi:hypothetical protein